MTNDIINTINTTLRGAVSYLMGNTYGVARIGIIKDNNKTKRFPVTRNYTQKNCNTDCEIILVPKRENKALLFWMEGRIIGRDYMTEEVQKITSTAKMFVWVNAEKLSTDEITADMIAGDIMKNVPTFIRQAKKAFGIHLLRQTYKFNGDDFKQFDWERTFIACPYLAFTVDFEFEYYMKADCFDATETMNLNKCNLPES